MIGNTEHSRELLVVAEQSLDIQEKIHRTGIAVCDLAFALAWERPAFHKRFVELGYTVETGPDAQMDNYWLTYDQDDDTTLQIFADEGEAFRLVRLDSAHAFTARQVLRSEPSRMPADVRTKMASHNLSTMTLAELFSSIGTVASTEPRVPTDEEVARLS